MEQTLKNTALLVMDMQTAMIGKLPGADLLINNVVQAITHARTKNLPVIYVIITFRPGAPELNIHGKGAASAGGREPWTADFSHHFSEIHPAVAPQASDVTVLKRRVSAFAGSDLEIVLRAQGVQHLVLTGYATSGVVLSTVREAADKDYQLTVLSDGCSDPDQEVHNLLTGKIFSRQAYILTVAEWCKA